MPELPEVETIRTDLESRILGTVIKKVIVKLEKLVGYPDPFEFQKKIRDLSIAGVKRRGKFLILILSSGYRLAVHLRMSGRLVLSSGDQNYEKHTHVIFKLNNNKELRFINPRQFGRLYLYKEEEKGDIPLLGELGPEPLSVNFYQFCELFAGSRAGVKSLLLNQRIIAGLGNIYTDEALFLSCIRPDIPISSLSQEHLKELFLAVRKILKKAVSARGTTRRDYVDSYGKAGNYQHLLYVYGRKGKSCKVCGESIKRMKVAGRSSYYCPECQRKGALLQCSG